MTKQCLKSDSKYHLKFGITNQELLDTCTMISTTSHQKFSYFYKCLSWLQFQSSYWLKFFFRSWIRPSDCQLFGGVLLHQLDRAFLLLHVCFVFGNLTLVNFTSILFWVFLDKSYSVFLFKLTQCKTHVTIKVKLFFLLNKL